MNYFKTLTAFSLLACLISCNDETVEPPVEEVSPLVQIKEEYEDPDSNTVLVAAHRAHWNSHPENSLSAIQSAIDLGVDIVELDIRITRDEQLVLMHDKTLDRTTTGSGEVKYTFLSQIKELQMKDWMGNVIDEQVPTLEEALTLAKGKVLVMIDKSEYLIPEVMEVVEKTETKDQVIFLGFDELAVVEERFGDNLDSIYYIPSLHKSMSNLDSYVSTFQQAISPSVYGIWFDSDDSEVLAKAPSLSEHSRIWVNTTAENQSGSHTDKVSLNNPADGWGWVINRDASILLTDYPASLLQYLRNIDRHE